MAELENIVNRNNDQELIQSNPTSHPQNQRGKKDTDKNL